MPRKIVRRKSTRTRNRTRKRTRTRTRKRTRTRTRKNNRKRNTTTRRSKKQTGGNKAFYIDSPGIIELVGNDFNGSNVKHKDVIGKPGILMMYADWCPHCSNPETQSAWKKLGQLMDGSNGWVGAMNCADEENGNKRRAKDIGVNGYPTIYMVRENGDIVI